MELYNLTLLKTSAVQRAVTGHFSSPKANEICVSRGNVLEMWSIDDNANVHVICSYDVFAQIRSIKPLHNEDKDYILVGSDSGRIVVLEYNVDKNQFIKVHQETYGRTGVRRIIPGQYICADPYGRAVMISAVEKQNIVYIFNRDKEGDLTISSPLEAHKSKTIVFATEAIDVGYNSPIFATLEVDYSEADEDPTGEAYKNIQKMLTYYQLDLGLNHVVRRWTDPTERTANGLLAVPYTNGIGGVLVFSESFITFKHEGHVDVRAVIPRRQTLPIERGTLIITSTCLKTDAISFFLVQSEYGDLYRITLTYSNQQVEDLSIKYYDTIPPASNLCITEKGQLLATFESGDHILYQITSLGDEEVTAESKASTLLSEDGNVQVPVFLPRPLRNLTPTDTMNSICPCTKMMAYDLLQEGMSQIYTLCGKGSRSTLRVLKSGLNVDELGTTDLGNVARYVTTVGYDDDTGYTKYIIVSFNNATLVLSTGESIAEVLDSGFTKEERTLFASILDGNSIIQVTPTMMKQIFSDGRQKIWDPPGQKRIVTATSNKRQILIGLESGELIYFELDERLEWNESNKLDLEEEITCIDLPDIPKNRLRSLFCAVGLKDNKVMILSLAPENMLDQIALLALSSSPSSVTLETMSLDENVMTSLLLSVGHINGLMMRVEVDPMTGELGEGKSTRFLGPKAVKLVKIKVNHNQCILALSTKPWLSYPYNGTYHMTPISFNMLDSAGYFGSEQYLDGIVGIQGTNLYFIKINKLNNPFTTSSVPLDFTPRDMAIYPLNYNLFIIEGDHNSYNLKERELLYKEESYYEEGATEIDVGSPIPATTNHWGSCIKVIEPSTLSILERLDLEENEVALSCCFVPFKDKGGEIFLVVGVAKNMNLHPKQCNEGYLYVYRVLEGRKMILYHKTEVNEAPKAICEYQGRLLVGLGKTLRLYELGKKKLLRKCENRSLPYFVNVIRTEGERIYVGDLAESFTFLKYRKESNQLVIFSDSPLPRSITAACVLDYHSIVAADKMGNIFIERIDPKTDDNVNNPTGNKVLWDTGFLNGAPNKNQLVASIHIGEIVTSLQKTTLLKGGDELILYTTILGKIGVLLPLSSRSDSHDFIHIEMWMRESQPSLCGRDIIAFRSLYNPIKSVIDGDLCELFNTLKYEDQYNIASALSLSVSKIQNKLEDIRSRVI
ncbi:hypothetical protein WA158_005726 [Blastocystis sp. Blastoise]